MNTKNISVLNYNVWFDSETKHERTTSLINNIMILNPDVVCFQEITQEVLDKIKLKLTSYYVFPKVLDRSYGCAIISKYPISKTKVYELKSNMCRNLLVAQIDVRFEIPDGDMIRVENKHILVTTCHYESEFNQVNPTKIQQFADVKLILDRLSERYGTIIHCADTNIVANEDNYYITKDALWRDAWIEMGSNQQHCYTYDCMTNDNLMHRKIKLRSRIDRIVYKPCGIINPIEFKLIKGIDDFIQPSDHHGIYAIFSMQYNSIHL